MVVHTTPFRPWRPNSIHLLNTVCVGSLQELRESGSRDTSPSAYSLLHFLTHHPTFLSCQSLPAFRAVVLYDRPWWDKYIRSLPPLGKRGTFFSASSRLSHIMLYGG
jgi:hypothetical protein